MREDNLLSDNMLQFTAATVHALSERTDMTGISLLVCAAGWSPRLDTCNALWVR